MKPNIAFLRKVQNCQVFRYKGYTMSRGGYFGFTGGEKTAERHVAAGYIADPKLSPELGWPAYFTLTEAGEAALKAAIK